MAVTGEPSLGTPKYHRYSFAPAVPGSDAVQTLDCSGQVPVGTTIVEGYFGLTATSTSDLVSIMSTSGADFTDRVPCLVSGVTNLGHFKGFLDSSLILRWRTTGFGTISSIVLVMTCYYC